MLAPAQILDAFSKPGSGLPFFLAEIITLLVLPQIDTDSDLDLETDIYIYWMIPVEWFNFSMANPGKGKLEH